MEVYGSDKRSRGHTFGMKSTVLTKEGNSDMWGISMWPRRKIIC